MDDEEEWTEPPRSWGVDAALVVVIGLSALMTWVAAAELETDRTREVGSDATTSSLLLLIVGATVVACTLLIVARRPARAVARGAPGARGRAPAPAGRRTLVGVSW